MQKAILQSEARLVESPYVAQERGISSGRAGSGRASTSGAPAWASVHSLGLSSTRMKLSSASPSSSASEPEVGALGRPIDAPGREIFQAQGHLGVRLEGFHHVAFVVLAGQRQQHPGAAQPGHELLPLAPRLVQHHAHRPILAANAGPQGLVAIERDHLVGAWKMAGMRRATAVARATKNSGV